MMTKKMSGKPVPPVVVEEQSTNTYVSTGHELENALQIKSWKLAQKCLTQGFGTNQAGIFHLAIRNGAPVELVSNLLAFNSYYIKEQFEGNFPLSLAVKFAPHLLPFLLQAEGVDVNCVTKDTGETPVLLACREGLDTSLLELLVQQGGDVNRPRTDGITPLIVATLRGDSALVEFLLHHGVHVNAVSKDGSSPLYLAASKTRDIKLMETLILHGADVSLGKNNGETPLFAVLDHVNNPEQSKAMIKLLLRAGANVNQTSLSGETPLLIACEKNVSPEVVKLLIQAGADVNKSSVSGMTPILLAVVKGASKELTLLLLENGAVLTHRFQNQSLSQLVQDRGFLHLVDLVQENAVVPLRGVERMDPPLEFTFCAQCLQSSSSLTPCELKCGLVAYCSPSCEEKHHAKHEDVCRAVLDRFAMG